MTHQDAAVPALVMATQTLVERVFGAVDTLRRRLLAAHDPADERESLHRRERRLREDVTDLLAAHRDIVIGMGLITPPGRPPTPATTPPHRVQWWQYLAGRDQPSALRVDLNPDSIGFYDCDAAEWFRVPRVSGQRHIVGPYVDAHGTDRYLLTFTVPLLVAGAFIGVVGADVPVSVFETRLLAAWGPQHSDVMIINQQRRVVVSNSPRALCGDLLAADATDAAVQRVELAGAPWHLLVVNRGQERAALIV